MTETEEKLYLQGQRQVWVEILQQALLNLGYLDKAAATASRWVMERESAIHTLRQVCRAHGDNDWEPELHLSDIIDKHLWRHLETLS